MILEVKSLLRSFFAFRPYGMPERLFLFFLLVGQDDFVRLYYIVVNNRESSSQKGNKNVLFRNILICLVLAVAVYGDDQSVILSRLQQRALAAASAYAPQFPKAMAAWRKDGSFADVEFDEVGDGDKWDGIRHWEYLNAMAWAWAAPQSYNRRSRELGERIYKSVIFWHRVKPWPLNTWWGQVGVPRRAKDVLILASPLLQQTQDGRMALMSPLSRTALKDDPEIVFIRSLLDRDFRRMREAANYLTVDLKIAPLNKIGLQDDGSYNAYEMIQQNQLGVNGVKCLEGGLSFAQLVKGTSFDLKDYQMNALRRLALDGMAWFLWKGRMDLHAMGGMFDEESRAVASNKAVASLRTLAEFDEDYRRGYQTVLMGNELGGENAFVGARVYWLADCVVVRQPNYYVSLQMTSKRTRPVADDLVRERQLGRYFSDGTLLLLMSGDEYKDVPDKWKWTRLPGTTLPDSPVYTQGQAGESGAPVQYQATFDKPNRWAGECDFTGAVSSGLHLSAIYSQNVDGVQALKAYFFAPGAIVCLGAGITSESPYPVETTVEQRRLAGDFVERTGGIWHGGVAFLGNGMLAKVAKAPLAQDMATDMLSIGISHGTGCRDKTYAVEIRPCVERERFTGLRPLSRIISNTTDLQAVEFADGAICAVFHKAGKVGDFETNTPCVFILEKDMMYLADPTHLVKTMSFIFRGQEYELTLPDGLRAGVAVPIRIAHP